MMRRRMWQTAIGTLLLLLAHTAFAEERADDAVAGQVSAATAEWISTFNTRDAARISALYAPDAILRGTVSKTIRTTPGEILEYFEESSAKRPNLRMVLGEYHVRLYGDIATNWCPRSGVRVTKRQIEPVHGLQATFQRTASTLSAGTGCHKVPLGTV